MISDSAFIQGVSTFASLLGDGIHEFIDSLQPNSGFEAEYGSESDIASVGNSGFMISKRRLSHADSFSNILCVGPTGSGKSVNIIAKNLFDLRGVSIIVNDAAKQFYPITSGYKSREFEIKILDFSEAERSSGYNILSRIRKQNDINKIASTLVNATFSNGSGDQFWPMQAEAIIALTIRLVLHQKRKYHNIANCISVLKYLAVEQEKVDEWVSATHDEDLVLDYKKFVVMPEKTAQNVLSTAFSAFQAFDSEILKVVSHDTIDFERMRRVPTLLYLQNSIESQKYIKVVNSIFYEQLYGYLLSTEVTHQTIPMYIIMDEASSCLVPSLPIAISNTRKMLVSNFLAIQSQSQLFSLYGKEAEDIISNCMTRIYLPGISDLETLRTIETLSGKREFVDKKGNKKIRSLITMDEIRMLPDGKSLILFKNKKLIKAFTSPYFNDAKYRGYAAIPPVPVRSDIPNEPIELFTTARND